MFPSTTKDNVANLKNAAANTASNLQASAEDAKDDLRETANKAGRTVRNFYNTAIDEVSQASDTVTKQIRTNPVQSSAIALGIGFVLGALFRRS